MSLPMLKTSSLPRRPGTSEHLPLMLLGALLQFCFVSLTVLPLLGAAPPSSSPSRPLTQEKAMSLHDLNANRIDGRSEPLKAYAGKVLLVVNVASECGFTPQYAGLQALYTQYKDRGFEVLGFPSNEFGGQEPGTDEQVQKFCTMRFGVTFPMFSKVVVKPGPEQAPVYKFLTEKHPAPKWNFSKYLVDRTGQVVAAFPSNVAPDSPELASALENALK